MSNECIKNVHPFESFCPFSQVSLLRASVHLRHFFAEAFSKMGDMTFIKGDEPAVVREKRNAVFNNQLWPGAVVPFSISTVFNGKLVRLQC